VSLRVAGTPREPRRLAGQALDLREIKMSPAGRFTTTTSSGTGHEETVTGRD
jgi:hypothetical protein